MSILCKLFYKLEEEGTFLNLFYQNLYQKWIKNLQKYYTLPSVMKLDAKTCKKY